MPETVSDYSPGALVRARGREWVVLPESTRELIMVRPLGGMDDEITGILPDVEEVKPATFSAPDPSKPGDHHACRLLRDAARISTRAAAGPFRSFGRIAVEPRPYQLVPLLMALRLDPVRLLIADDVGIGKTIEACLVVRELLDRGEIERFAVLCPPHLAEQWQRELSEKFHIDAELVLSSTIQRLERTIRSNTESVFTRYPFVIVSMDFVKQPRHRDEFLRDCPELVIVDEAHGCTLAGAAGQARQMRHTLVRKIADDENRHLILVTATPHSGNEDAFRSLLALLSPEFKDLSEDLGGDERSAIRRELAKHLVQRRRRDIVDYVGANTSFPKRLDAEITYTLSPDYKKLFTKILAFAGEMVRDPEGNKRQRRVRWWSALALLRSMASSPRAAASTLRNRAATASAETEAEADDLGRRVVLDDIDSDSTETLDFTPGGDAYADAPDPTLRNRLLAFAREADALAGSKDSKLQQIVAVVKDLLSKGHNPILFCRFIDTAEYVAEQLRTALKKEGVEIAAITGTLPPKDREDRIAELGNHPRRILVCTDCLSEGVNLQEHFDAVIHYDLSWNPTRHEQREGRVDRFGQPKPEIRTITYIGKDNQIDGIVLDVLLRKHKQIKSDLGISVAVPGSSEDVVEAILEGMLLRGHSQDDTQPMLPHLEEWLRPQRDEIHARWEDTREKEQRSRSRYAQNAIKTEEVAAELAATREAIGAGPATEQFIRDVFHLAGVPLTDKSRKRVVVNLSNETPRGLRNALGRDDPFTGRFDLPVGDGEVYLSRTHPITEAAASWVLDTALDEVEAAGQKVVARRCGVTRTSVVTQKTTLLLVRLRYHLISRTATGERTLLAEEIVPLAFTGNAASPKWLASADADMLLSATPSGNVLPTLVQQQLEGLISRLAEFHAPLNEMALLRAKTLLEAHNRVRESAKLKGPTRVEPVLPIDILGCFILLPHA